MADTDAKIINPVATKTLWFEKNPILLNGQIGIEVSIVSGVVQSSLMKVGDGQTNWNDLPYLGGNVYPYTDAVNNAFGDIKSGDVLFGKSVVDILRDMLVVYINPSLNSFKIQGKSALVYEIGTQVSGSITFTWGTSSGVNLLSNSGVFSQSAVVLNEVGVIDVKTTTSKVTTLIAPYKKNVPGSISFTLRGKSTKNINTNLVEVFMYWYSRIRWGSLQVPFIQNQEEIDSLKDNKLSGNFRGYYDFDEGYPFIAIPEFFGNSAYQIVGYAFKAVNPATNGLTGFDFPIARQDNPSIEPTSVPYVVYNNGDTSYKCIILRAANEYGAKTKLLVE